MGRGKQKDRVNARDLICYFTVIELGESMVDLVRIFDLKSAALSYAVHRGEKIAKDQGYQLDV